MITGPVLVFVDFANSFYCAKISFYRKIKKTAKIYYNQLMGILSEFVFFEFGPTRDIYELRIIYRVPHICDTPRAGKFENTYYLSAIHDVQFERRITIVLMRFPVRISATLFEPLNFVREKHNNNNNISDSPQRQFVSSSISLTTNQAAQEVQELQ